ncbi:MAG: MFS transporter [Gaiellaceae bacterium]
MAFRRLHVSFTVNLVYFVRDVGLSPLQLVLTGTAMEATIFACEIPTGVVADRFTRRGSVVVGWLIQGGGLVLMGATHSFVPILAAFAVWGLGHTFTSGAYEAWITDELGADRIGPVFVRGGRVATAAALPAMAGSVAIAAWLGLGTAVVAGGLVVIGLGLASALAMPETGFVRVPRGERPPLVAAAREGARTVRGRPVLVVLLTIAFFYGMSTESFDRLWQAHFVRDVGLPAFGGLDPVWWFGVFGVCSLLLGLAASTVLLRRLRAEPRPVLARTLTALTLVQLVAVVVFGLAGGVAVACGAYLVYTLTRTLVSPLYTTWLNQSITDSRVRATVLSMAGQADAIGQSGGGPLLGLTGNLLGIRAALLAGAAALAPALGLYARTARRVQAPQPLPAP